MGITFENMNEALSIMGQGMLGIFIVTGVIVTCIYLLNKIFKKK